MLHFLTATPPLNSHSYGILHSSKLNLSPLKKKYAYTHQKKRSSLHSASGHSPHLFPHISGSPSYLFFDRESYYPQRAERLAFFFTFLLPRSARISREAGGQAVNSFEEGKDRLLCIGTRNNNRQILVSRYGVHIISIDRSV